MQGERDVGDVALSFIEVELRSGVRRRHWSPSSQTYAPADVLLERLVDGWNIDPVVGREEYWYGTGRHVSVYYCRLTKGLQAVTMPVLGNPVVRRLMREHHLKVVLLDDDYAMVPAGIVAPA